MDVVSKIEGKRKNSVLYKVGNYLYNNEKEQKSNMCPGRGVIAKSDFSFKITQNHLCNGHYCL